jgi:hypothetical protein
MNEWNRLQMALDPLGLTESCDRCNALIINCDWMEMSFLTFDGQIVCNNCRGELLKERLTKVRLFDIILEHENLHCLC